MKETKTKTPAKSGAKKAAKKAVPKTAAKKAAGAAAKSPAAKKAAAAKKPAQANGAAAPKAVPVSSADNAAMADAKNAVALPKPGAGWEVFAVGRKKPAAFAPEFRLTLDGAVVVVCAKQKPHHFIPQPEYAAGLKKALCCEHRNDLIRFGEKSIHSQPAGTISAPLTALVRDVLLSEAAS